MIWIYLTHILSSNRFSGITRTEYELASYARKLQKQGKQIQFCRFDPRVGFVAIPDYAEIDQALSRLSQKGNEKQKRNTVVDNRIKKRMIKLQTSVLKRLKRIQRWLGVCANPFQNGDTLVTVGQDIGCGDMLDLLYIKRKIGIKVHVMNHDIIPITHPQHVNIDVKKFTNYIDSTIRVTNFFWCNSEFTKIVLQNYMRLQSSTIPPMDVVTLGCDIGSKLKTDLSSPMISDLLREPYILYVSTIESRKNHKVLYQAYMVIPPKKAST